MRERLFVLLKYCTKGRTIFARWRVVERVFWGGGGVGGGGGGGDFIGATYVQSMQKGKLLS